MLFRSIAPHVLDGRLLADGGILDPLPMAPIASANADLTVAVSVSGMEADQVADVPAGAETKATRERLNKLLRRSSALFDRFGAAAEVIDTDDIPDDADADEEAEDALADDVRETAMPKLGSFAVMMRTIDIAQAALARHQMAAYPPDEIGRAHV